MPKWNESAVGWIPERTRGRAPPETTSGTLTSGSVVGADMGGILPDARQGRTVTLALVPRQTDFLVLSRASADAASVDDDALDERHQAYMDGFADRFTARGPLLDPTRTAWRGSMHVVSLGSVEAARAFAADEPYHGAGLYADHRVWAFEDLLGRTMWEFDAPAGPRFLVVVDRPVVVPDASAIVHGALTDPTDGSTAGRLLCVQAPSRTTVDGWLVGADAEVHDWEFGGRR